MNILIAFVAGLVGGLLAFFVAIRPRQTRRPATTISSKDALILVPKPTQEKQKIVGERVRLSRARDFQDRARKLTIPGQYREMAEIKDNIENDLLGTKGVVGLGVRNRVVDRKIQDDIVLSVFVDANVDENELISNSLIQAVPENRIQIVRTGKIVARGTGPPPANRIVPVLNWLNRRIRPAVGGVSISRDQGISGTLATCCYEHDPLPTTPPIYYALSNNHIIANLNDSSVGDAILQPGTNEGGTYPADFIAWLAAKVDIQFMNGVDPIPENLVDAAIAAGHFSDLDNTIYWTGNLNGVKYETNTHDEVQKTGAFTAYTRSRIVDVDATIDVEFSNGKVARFKHQLTMDRFSEQGDSGSLIVDSTTRRAVGLLFADSVEDELSYANKILYVEELLGVRISETGGTYSGLIDPS